MRAKSFGAFTEEIRSLREWEDVFPRDVDEIMKAYAEQYRGFVIPDSMIDEGYSWRGAKDVLNVLEHRALSGPRLYAAVRSFRHDVQRIYEGQLPYGRYTKADRVDERPRKDYEAAVRRFTGLLKRADPRLNTAPFERSLLFVRDQPLKITNEKHRDLIMVFCKQFIAGLETVKREGRPVQSDNLFLYHLVNNLTVYRRKKDGTPMKDKRGLYKLERRWGDAARVLIWVHYKRMPIPWMSSFVRRFARSPVGPTLIRLHRVIQHKYGHLGPPPDKELRMAPEETRFHPLGRTVFVYAPDDRGKSGFKAFPI